MKSEILEKLNGKISYKTYNCLSKILLYSALGADFSVAILDDPEIFRSLVTSSWILLGASLGMNFSSGKFYTKDINNIKKLYDDFLNNYKKLNKNFELNNPIEIYSMYVFLLNNGYLSKNKEFHYSSKVTDSKCFLGEEAMSGNGCCRNISSMLTDIFNKSNLKSVPLRVYLDNKYGKEIKFETVGKSEAIDRKTSEWIDSHVKNKASISMISDLLKECSETGMSLKVSRETIENARILKSPGTTNHAITYVRAYDRNYYFDPTNEEIYHMSEMDPGMLYSDDIVVRYKKVLYRPREKEDSKIIKKILLPENTTKEEEKRFIREVQDICSDNLDYFDRFYDENKDIYEEVTDKLVKVKKR